MSTIARIGSDVVAVDVEPRLKAGCEKVLTDSRQNLVGFRLLYADAVQPAPVPSDWPHHLFVRSDIVSRLFRDGTLPATFSEFLNSCRSISANDYRHRHRWRGAGFEYRTRAAFAVVRRTREKDNLASQFSGE